MYRGYIFSRSFMGERVPQHIQNLVIREFCKKKSIEYLLSVTEYAMPNNYLMLNQIIEQLDLIDGIIFYSLFQLPFDNSERIQIIKNILQFNKKVFFAVEDLKIFTLKDLNRIENIWNVRKFINECPKIIRY